MNMNPYPVRMTATRAAAEIEELQRWSGTIRASSVPAHTPQRNELLMIRGIVRRGLESARHSTGRNRASHLESARSFLVRASKIIAEYGE